MIEFDKLTPEAAALAKFAWDKRTRHPILESAPGRWNKDQEDVARMVRELCYLEGESSETLAQIAGFLPPWVFTAVVLSCACCMGLEKIEQTNGWPARSARLIIQIGLDEIKRRGVRPCLVG